MNIFRLKGRDRPAQESRRGGREPPLEGGPKDGGVFLRLGAQGSRGAVQVAPKTAAAAVAASGVLVVVELRVSSARWLGAAIQEAGERAGYERCLGG